MFERQAVEMLLNRIAVLRWSYSSELAYIILRSSDEVAIQFGGSMIVFGRQPHNYEAASTAVR